VEQRTGQLCLRVVAPPRLRSLAVDVLATNLGIDRSEAGLRLDTGMAADRLSADAAQRLRSILSAAGLAVTVADARSPARTSLSVQLSVWADAPRVVRRLAMLLDRDAAGIAASIARPGGLVFPDLTSAEHTRLVALLGRVRGTVLTSSDPETALFDVHVTRRLSADEDHLLRTTLAMAGCREDALTGAVATGLSRDLCDRILSRLAHLGLLSVDQCFQRFDLLLTGTSGWVTRDLGDFLAARTQQPRARFETLSAGSPVKLDLGLTAKVARQFCADYAAIGLFVRPVLSGRSGNP